MKFLYKHSLIRRWRRMWHVVYNTKQCQNTMKRTLKTLTWTSDVCKILFWNVCVALFDNSVKWSESNGKYYINKNMMLTRWRRSMDGRIYRCQKLFDNTNQQESGHFKLEKKLWWITSSYDVAFHECSKIEAFFDGLKCYRFFHIFGHFEPNKS